MSCHCFAEFGKNRAAREVLKEARYSLFLVVPSLLGFACILDASIKSTPHLLCVAAVCALAQFITVGEHYFRRLDQTGGHDGPAFRTGALEPKAAVVDAIVARTGGPVTIFAEDWWCYMPVRKDAHTNDLNSAGIIERGL